MTQITMTLHYPPGDMPDADTDVIVFDASSPIGQLGAYIGEESDDPVWNDAQGFLITEPVVAWAEMPALPSRPEPLALALKGGQQVDLTKPWAMPC